MVRTRIPLVVLTLVLAAAAAWWALHDGTERAVRRRVTRLAELVNKDGPEHPFVQGARAEAIASCFTPEFLIFAPAEELSGSYTFLEMSRRMAYARGEFALIDLRLFDLRIEVQPDDRASARFTGRLQGRLQGGARVDEVRELKAELVHTNREWRIHSVEVVEVLRR